MSSIAMVRTQIYLEKDQLKALNRLRQETGKSQSELIREAIDVLAQRHAPGDRLSLLRAGRGLWKGRDDLPDFAVLRSETDSRLHSDD